LAREGKKSIIMGVPPNFPPRRIHGISVGCFLTPDPAKDEFTYPASLKTEIQQLVGRVPRRCEEFPYRLQRLAARRNFCHEPQAVAGG
jgi:predicted AlkP superfamily phosphohydrolase/phosphomutase